MPRSTASHDIEQGIARARRLSLEQPAASVMLDFYAELCAFQQSVAAGAKPVAEVNLPFADTVDLTGALASLPGLTEWLKTTAPPPLAQAAEQLRAQPERDVRALLMSALADDPALDGSVEGFVAEALLQPFASEAARSRPRDAWPADPRGKRPSRCPVCGGRPVAGALMEEGHGARRTLVCGLCLTGWDYHRVLCAWCPEERFDALPVYTADTLPYVRIEACDTCHHYIKTMDLSKNGLAVPVVDDLATPMLDLWARERGYERTRSNVLRL